MNKKFLNLGTALSREQMKKVTGGCGMGELCYDDGGNCSCSCTGTAGTWHYTGGAQPSNSYLHSDISQYCGSYGGSCTNCTNWQP